MADIAGLAIGVAALWESCVQVYKVIDSAQHHGIEYELLNVKYEVERVRLICWGDAVGLSGLLGQIQTETQASATPTTQPTTTDRPASPQPKTQLDTRLSRADVRAAVLRVLGCIQHLFEKADRVQDRYGLHIVSDALVQDENLTLTTPRQRVLAAVFKRAYANFRRATQERHHASSLVRKTVWAVYDRVKFAGFVAELRGFNDSLESLFPDVKKNIIDAMRNDINSTVELYDLQLLHEAMSEDHEELSELASIRLDALGATVSTRTELLQDLDNEDKSDTSRRTEHVSKDVKQGAHDNTAPTDLGVDELTKRLRDVEDYIKKKGSGAIIANIVGPFPGSGNVYGEVSWSGLKEPLPRLEEWVKINAGAAHVSFALYKRKKYMRKTSTSDSEDDILLDPECHTAYEAAAPGTVTVEGYGLECWEFEETTPREMTVVVNRAILPGLTARRILRRLSELQEKKARKFGWHPLIEELDLREFAGELGSHSTGNAATDRDRRIGDLYRLLNRSDVFVDFTSTSSVCLQMFGGDLPGFGLWDFLRQIILAWELDARLKIKTDNAFYAGFTDQILASLVISELWLRNTRVDLREDKSSLERMKRPETEAETAKAEELKGKGNDALKKNDFQSAVDLYTKAIEIDNGNAVYPSNRSAALVGLGRHEEAVIDAHAATTLDPTYAKAWSRLGLAFMKKGLPKCAMDAYKTALDLAGSKATPQMRHGLARAEESFSRAFEAIKQEKDAEKRFELESDFFDQDWNILGKTITFHSQVHERQVEGLLLFAEHIKWPYINELRDYAEDVYSNYRGGQTINSHLYDWLFGLTLPGKWFSSKLMTALILCTPSIKEEVGVSRYLNSGLALPTRSYWRLRTVLGSVLGGLPRVISLCGWIGPCPHVDFDPPTGERKVHHVRVKARRIALTKNITTSGTNIMDIADPPLFFSDMWMRPTEEIEPYLAEIRKASDWIVPEPPVRDMSTCEIMSIQLKQLPPETNTSQNNSRGVPETAPNRLEAGMGMEYRASIAFKIDNNQSPVTFKLFTNPIFVQPPACSGGPHPAHMRELPRFQKSIWTVEQLHGHTAEAMDGGDVMVINATGQGAETLARAWCSERGKCAVIRRPGGPCYVCSVRTASLGSLNTGVLIWVE